MEKLEKAIRYSNLFYIYKSQLSKSQQEVIEDYFLLDLSISEIASNRGISRSAVEDALSKGIQKLEDLEKNLKILERENKIKESLDKLKSKALNLSEIEEIENIERDLTHGI